PPTPGETDEPVPKVPAHGHGHGGHEIGHESPPIMTVPLLILAACAILVGMIFGPTGWFEHHPSRPPGFEELGHPDAHGMDPVSMSLGLLAGVGGIVLAWSLYGRPSPVSSRLAESLRPLYNASLHKFYVDEFYERTVVALTWVLARVSAFFDT